MSMLDRYRKPGGFIQLLTLIETCHQAKQDKLLEMIANEDLRWSETVRAKMLSIERIYSWSDQVLAEVFGSLQDLTVAVALSAAAPEFKIKITAFFTHGRIRKIDDIMLGKSPTPAEVSATHMKVVEAVRRMLANGFIRYDAIDPVLTVNDDIDDYLSHPAIPGDITPAKRFAALDGVKAPQPSASQNKVLHAYSPMQEHMAAAGMETTTGGSPVPAPRESFAHHEHTESRLMELQQLKKRVADLSKENATLRHDLSMAKSKLDQIKKIA